MGLFQESGGTSDDRVAEAHSICSMLENSVDELTNIERNFVEKMADTQYCSPKQLFWLRDIKDKYL